MTTKHYPAAFINVIAETGTKEEAIKYLQQTWNDLCALRDEHRQLLADYEEIREKYDALLADWKEAT